MRKFISVLVGLAALGAASPIPHYDHVFVIIEENEGIDRIIGNPAAPNLNRLAKEYGLATQYFGIVHPSEGNYVAMLGGDTFGIHDDDAPGCVPLQPAPFCPNTGRADYVPHRVSVRSLTDQLADAGLDWRGYFESLPVPGSDAVVWPRVDHPLYAVKHNGFMNFANVENDPARTRRIVDFIELQRDLASGRMPNFIHIVPNQCDDMHGLPPAKDTPADCVDENVDGRVARGDRVAGELVDAIMKSKIWQASGNAAIVITWDEDDVPREPKDPQGCCGYDPKSIANFGGGHIPTIVITNHGPRGVTDATPYNHYSLLRTIEDAFGITEHLHHAADDSKGVVPMTPLFATP